MLCSIRVFATDSSIVKYRKNLYNRAINAVQLYGELDPFDGSVVLFDREFDTVGEAVQYMAKTINRRGNRKLIPYKDWLFYNRLMITDWSMKGGE